MVGLIVFLAVITLVLSLLLIAIDFDWPDKMGLLIAILFFGFVFTVAVTEKTIQEIGVETYVQHPEKFKIEYTYELKDTTLIVIDTIFTLRD